MWSGRRYHSLDYYLKENGAMAKDEWIGNYYVDENGKWVPGKT